MSHNTFGHLFRVTTFGESHGSCIGCVIDGCPPGLPLSDADIQPCLDARRPGTSRYVTQRREPDRVRVLSGIHDQGNGPHSTGTPICLIIDNVDQKSKDYSAIAQSYRPGHADFTYDAKYGIRDPRGGGRASARETAARVAAGAVARIALGPEISLRSALIQIGPHAIPSKEWDWNETANNPFRCPHAKTAEIWAQYLDNIRKNGSSAGAVVHVEALGVPSGWGAPVYGKLDAELAAALMSINAVKGVEIGSGFALVSMEGKASTDQMRAGPRFLSNHNGGILGGISTGQPIIARIALKPTSSLPAPGQTITDKGENTEIQTKGRHDPCVGIRAAPIAEAMMACTLLDHKLRHRGQIGGAEH